MTYSLPLSYYQKISGWVDMLTLTKQLTDFASGLFDVVGISQLSNVENLLILGLESRTDRNLDEFGYLAGHFLMYGYEEYVSPRLDSVLNFIRCKGFRAEPVGRYGYPLNGQLYLKGEAIRTGLGKRGKNTLLLHPQFGPRLRLVAVLTDAPVVPLIEPLLYETENPVCDGCSICIDACPEKILEPYRMIAPSRCRSDSDNMAKQENRLIPCDRCVKLCPAGGK